MYTMVKITEELVRKKAEHNEGEIYSLEELSLHQENIEKIEHLQHWCRNLEILLLQSNLISKIENLHKLKCLKYLNLAVNNVEVIENLERCESLEKLDLTLNFIGDLESVCSLQNNIHLTDLYLTGNPCTEFYGYRDYVIAKLPQIQNLDNTDVTLTERIKATQLLPFIESKMRIDQENYKISRKNQRERLRNINQDNIPDEIFWKQQSEHSPEVRVEMARRQIRARADDKEKKEEKKPVNLFNKDGRPLNMNQAKVKFHVDFYHPEEIILDLAIFKFLDTNLLDVDVQPTYVRVKIKNKIFQLVLPEEVCTSSSIVQRSQTTGHLLIRMPKVNAKKSGKIVPENDKIIYKDPSDIEKQQRREYLEIGPSRLTQLCNIVENNEKKQTFDDNYDVPPLE